MKVLGLIFWHESLQLSKAAVAISMKSRRMCLVFLQQTICFNSTSLYVWLQESWASISGVSS